MNFGLNIDLAGQLRGFFLVPQRRSISMRNHLQEPIGAFGATNCVIRKLTILLFLLTSIGCQSLGRRTVLPPVGIISSPPVKSFEDPELSHDSTAHVSANSPIELQVASHTPAVGNSSHNENIVRTNHTAHGADSSVEESAGNELQNIVRFAGNLEAFPPPSEMTPPSGELPTDSVPASSFGEQDLGGGCCESPWIRSKSFSCNLAKMLKDDTIGVAQWENLFWLAVAGGGAVAIRQDWDGDVREWTAQHPERWGYASEALGTLGDYKVQVPALVAFWGYAKWTDDAKALRLSESMVSAYALTGASTLLIKAAANTSRPTDEYLDGNYGFPSHHTAASFTLAAVIDEYYGPKIGLPAYAMAGLIGWSRIDQRRHDLSDVVFGAALGYVIGKSVANRHLTGDSRVRIFPSFNPADGSSEVRVEIPY